MDTHIIHSVKGAHLETKLHQVLEPYRKQGEWFNCDAQLAIDALNKLKHESDIKLTENIEKLKSMANGECENMLFEQTQDGMIHLTLPQLKLVKELMLNKLIAHAETPNYLSKMLGLNPMVISGWVKRKQVSKKGAQLVEDHPTLGQHFTAIELRPDL